MTYLKQNILAAGLLVLSLGTSVGLGYALNINEPVIEAEKNCVQLKQQKTNFQFNHSLNLLAPQLG